MGVMRLLSPIILWPSRDLEQHKSLAQSTHLFLSNYAQFSNFHARPLPYKQALLSAAGLASEQTDQGHLCLASLLHAGRLLSALSNRT